MSGARKPQRFRQPSTSAGDSVDTVSRITAIFGRSPWFPEVNEFELLERLHRTSDLRIDPPLTALGSGYQNLAYGSSDPFNSPLSAQGSRSADRSPADRADVESVDAIIAAVYDVISGPAGQERDWARMRSLFIPGARLMPTFRDSTSTWRHRVTSVDKWITGADPVLVRDGFFERELHRVAERYGNIVHLFNSYDSKRSPEAEPFARGINSFQLLYDGSRYLPTR